MDRNSAEFKELVYDMIIGNFDLKSFPMEEIQNVKCEFENGKYCEEKYEKVYVANRRLCERLGVSNEDIDVETIISALQDIQKYLCMKMYDYGAMFVLHEKETSI